MAFNENDPRHLIVFAMVFRRSFKRSSGGATVGTTIVGAVRNVLGGVFGIITRVLLTFYILSAFPAILVAASVSPGLAAGGAVFFIVQQQLENTVLVPKITGRHVGPSAVTVIGAILSVPTAAVIQVFVQELVTQDA